MAFERVLIAIPPPLKKGSILDALTEKKNLDWLLSPTFLLAICCHLSFSTLFRFCLSPAFKLVARVVCA